MNEPHQLTIQQTEAIKKLAADVKADYKNLEMTEIINRIHYITGRNFKKCIEGFKFMFALKLIEPEFILNAQQLPGIERMIVKSFPIISAMDATIVRAESIPQEAKKMITGEIVKAMIEDAVILPDGPSDDEGLILPHLDSNF